MAAPTQKPQRCALYARISPTPKGKAGENFSIESQLHEMRVKALADFGDASPAEYIDRNQMGGTLDRPALDRLRDMVALKMYDVIIVYDPSRWTREPSDKIILKREIEKGGARLVYVTVQYDDTAEGGLSEDVQDAVSKYEKRKFKERSRRCRRQKSRDGHPHAGMPPNGYKYEGHSFGKKGEWVIVPERETVIKLIFERTAASLSQYQTALWLNAQGIRTLKGFHWRPESVSQVLRKTSYTGTVMQNGVAIKVPVIIPQELWDRAHAAQARNKLDKGRPSRHYLLSGLLWCKLCGKRCRTLPKRGGEGSYRCAYVNPANRAERYCSAPEIRAHLLEPVIWDAIWDQVCDSDLLWELIEAYYDRVVGKKGKAAKDPTVAQIERARRLVDRAAKILNDPDNPIPYDQAKSNLDKARRDLAEAEMKAPVALFAMPARQDVNAAAAEFRKMRAGFKDFDLRKKALKSLVKEILYADREAEIRCRITARKSNRRECGNWIIGGDIPFVINCRIPEPPPVERTDKGRYLPKTRVA